MPRRTPDPNEGHGLPLPLEEVQEIVTRVSRSSWANLDASEEFVADFMATHIHSGAMARYYERHQMPADGLRRYIARCAKNRAARLHNQAARRTEAEAAVAVGEAAEAPQRVPRAARSWLAAAIRVAASEASQHGLDDAWRLYEQTCLLGMPKLEAFEEAGLSRAAGWRRLERAKKHAADTVIRLARASAMDELELLPLLCRLEELTGEDL
jgi:hypothetical protein